MHCTKLQTCRCLIYRLSECTCKRQTHDTHVNSYFFDGPYAYLSSKFNLVSILKSLSTRKIKCAPYRHNIPSAVSVPQTSLIILNIPLRLQKGRGFKHGPQRSTVAADARKRWDHGDLYKQNLERISLVFQVRNGKWQ